jgi:hypothetical protein
VPLHNYGGVMMRIAKRCTGLHDGNYATQKMKVVMLAKQV